MKPLTLLLPLALSSLAAATTPQKPNIVFIIADDIGYGDLGCYGATLIKTPNLDALAQHGVRFTNAYSPASTSSPTRYALLTGQYAWRQQVGIMAADAPIAIHEHQNTLPKLLKTAGYQTAIVGKWHLGLGTPEKPVDFNKTIEGGMRSVGFDYSFIFPATNDRVPTIYIENDRTVNLTADSIRVSYKAKIGTEPTGKENPELLTLKHISPYHNGTIINGVGRIGWMTGGAAARWKDEELSDTLLQKATQFIQAHADTTFFLYYATHTAHEPRVAAHRFKGTSQAGPYGDVIEEFDYCVGAIVKTLQEQGILHNTLIIVTSDNGPMIKEGYQDNALEQIGEHTPFAGMRGTKYTLYEGGTKVPFIARWDGGIAAPFVQNQRFGYIDIMATLAALTGVHTSATPLLDSHSALALFQSSQAPTYRPYILTQNNGGQIALRRQQWKYIPPFGKWGAQLYNLQTDPAEQHNLASDSLYHNQQLLFKQDVKNLGR